jgi:hypothetical protein
MIQPRSILLWLGLMPLLGAVGCSASLAVGSPDDFEFERFDAVYELGITENGYASLDTTETLVARFPDFDQNRGITRYLPTTYTGRPLNTEVLGVFDGDGAERAWSTESDGEALVVESVVPFGEFVRGSQTYVIDYRQSDVVRDFSTTTGIQEFYWDVNGTGWPQPFQVVTAEIRVPASLSASVTPDGEACYQGEEGSTTRCEIVRLSLPDGSLRFKATAGPLQPFQTMTVAIGFGPGTFDAAPADSIPPLSAVAHLIALLAGAVAVGWGVWVRVESLRDAAGYPVVIPQYLPPDNASIEQATVLRSQTAKLPLAGLLSLAVSGAIRLSEQEGWGKNWSITRTETSLTTSQSTLLEVLFGSVLGPGETLRLPKNSTSVAKRLDQWVSRVRKEMTSEGFYRQVPLVSRMGPGLVAGLAGMTSIAGFVFLNDQEGNLLTWIGGGSGLAMAAAAIFAVAKTPLATAGAELRDYLKGLTEYIKLAETDRLHYLQSPQGALREKISADDPRQVLKLYERLLPWAVVVGEEKRWVKELDRLYRDESPTWITGQNTRLLSSLGSLSQATASSFRSSSTGGTGGGGSAGGGGGGGGGGGR